MLYTIFNNQAIAYSLLLAPFGFAYKSRWVFTRLSFPSSVYSLTLKLKSCDLALTWYPTVSRHSTTEQTVFSRWWQQRNGAEQSPIAAGASLPQQLSWRKGCHALAEQLSGAGAAGRSRSRRGRPSLTQRRRGVAPHAAASASALLLVPKSLAYPLARNMRFCSPFLPFAMRFSS